MLYARGKQFLAKAKPVPNYNSNSSKSLPSTSKSPAPAQSPPPSLTPPPLTPSPPTRKSSTSSTPSLIPPTPPSAKRKSSVPTLLLSTLGKASYSDASLDNTSNKDVNSESVRSQIEELGNDDPLNTGFSDHQMGQSVENVETYSPLNRNYGSTCSGSIRNNDLRVENVVASPSLNQSLRRTYSGGIRNTPRRSAAMKGKLNLVKGGNKKIDSIEKVGEFTTKYKATSKTKHLITKHGREAAENLLKLNNSEIDGLNEKDNGFLLIYKCGDKAFIVNEGQMGRKMLEDDKYRNEVFETAKNVEIDLKTPMLSSILKSQYCSNKSIVSTPEAHKRANYRGIGAASKRKKTVQEDEDPKSAKAKKAPPRKRIIDVTFDNDHEEDDDEDDESLDLETAVNDDEDESPWLNSLIRQELDSAPVLGSRSKPPKKQAKQMFPFRCSECPAKYKTSGNFEKHLRNKHGLQ